MKARTQQVGESKQDSMSDVAEEFVYDLLSRIQPAPASELRRKDVARYVQDTIARAFQPTAEVQAFMYGSVPLKTYLPDGDIDLAIFHSRGNMQHLRDTWFTQLSTYLRQEENNPHAPFRIQDVQVIYAEVKLVKCLVDNIVVDISFQSLGGLCTVNFLEAIDRKIDNHHLFKRSIILVKAWCYYESRLLGAHHGLISTYALETMVLYIFIIHHKIVDTPLKVLHKFLTVFSTFDWDNMCLSLNGPIPLKTFPNPKPIPLQVEDQPLLTEEFMAGIRSTFRLPGISSEPMPAIGPRSFQLKFLNIMDPLLPTNNLGRSVNRASFARVKRALGIGARRVTELLNMDHIEGEEAAKSFFRNTWNAQRTPASRSPLQEVSVANGHSAMRQNGVSGLQGDQTAAAATASTKHAHQHHLSLPPYSSSQGSQQHFAHQNLQRWMAQQQNGQNGGLGPAPTPGFPSRPSQQNSSRAPPQTGTHLPHSQKSPAQRAPPNLTKATSAELTMKSSSVDSQDAGEAQLRKAIPARKAPSGTPSNSAKLRKLATQMSESPPEGPGRLGAWKEAPSPQIAMPVCLGHQVVNQQLIPMWTHISMPLGQFSPTMYRQYPVYHLKQQLRPPLNGGRNNQPSQPITANGQSKSVPNSAKSQKASQIGTARYSDPGSSITAERQHAVDVTLAGDLDGLHHHLESARAMFTPQLSNGHQSAGSRGERDPPGARTPLRPSSSMGNLGHQKTMSNQGPNIWPNPILPSYMINPFDLHHHQPLPPNNGHLNIQKPRHFRPPSAMPENQQHQTPPPPAASESLTSTSGPRGSSDVGSSRADSPAPTLKQPAAPANGAGGAGEWPLPGSKATGWTPETLRGPLPRSSASEGWPGWASPVGSSESAASMPAMRNLRLDEQEPALNRGNLTEAAEVDRQREHGKVNHSSQIEWQKEFLLDNEKDFPGLPNAKAGVNGMVRNAEIPKSWRPVSSNVKAR